MPWGEKETKKVNYPRGGSAGGGLTNRRKNLAKKKKGGRPAFVETPRTKMGSKHGLKGWNTTGTRPKRTGPLLKNLPRFPDRGCHLGWAWEKREQRKGGL